MWINVNDDGYFIYNIVIIMMLLYSMKMDAVMRRQYLEDKMLDTNQTNSESMSFNFGRITQLLYYISKLFHNKT